jgi:hypothetical protein
MTKVVVAGVISMAVRALLLASVALASSHHPKGDYAQFAECPLNRETITDCVYSASTGGSFTIGKKIVPVKNPVIFQGGFEGSSQKIHFFGAENGETLAAAPQPVAGGLLNIAAPANWPAALQEWFNEQVGSVAEVKATLELAGSATSVDLNTENLLYSTGTALGLPVKIKLENAILGNNCYLGSDSSPIQIDFTTGKSGSLEGSVGKVKLNNQYGMVSIKAGRLVNGTFAAPRASGCGGIFSTFVDPLIDEVLGVPAASGENNAVLEGTLDDAPAPAVKASG